MLMLGLRTLSVRTFREGTMTLSSLPWILRLIRSTYGIGSGKSAGVIAFTGTRGGTLPGTILTSELRGPASLGAPPCSSAASLASLSRSRWRLHRATVVTRLW